MLLVFVLMVLYGVLDRIESRVQKDFAVADTASITSIAFANDTINITLSAGEQGWMLNGSNTVNANALNAIKNVLYNLQAKAPIPTSISDSLKKTIARNGLLVTLWAQDRVIREFYIYPTTKFNIGCVGLIKGCKQGYILELPGFKGDIAKLFVVHPDYWKSNRILPRGIETISQVDVEIPDAPEKSFRLSFDSRRNVTLRAIYFNQRIAAFDTAAAKRFVTRLTGLSYERVAHFAADEDRVALLMSQPTRIFTIKFNDSTNLVIKTYPMPVDEHLDEFGRTVNFDLNRLYVSLHGDSTIVVATYMVFDPVLKDIVNFKIKN